MGDHRPSPAPPCPHTPGPGLAAFRTSPSLDWVSPVALAENMVWGTTVPFLSLGFFPYPVTQLHSRILSIYYYQDHPTVT